MTVDQQRQRWTNPKILGDTVRLRGIDARDSEAMWDMVNDPVGTELTATSADFTRDQVEEWCATRMHQDHRLDLAIVELCNGEFAGEAVLNEYEAEDESANFRISLRGLAWFGRGLGSEAIRLVVEYAFSELGLRLLRLEVLQRNHRARRVYEKTGFTVSRTFCEEGERWVTMELAANRSTG